MHLALRSLRSLVSLSTVLVLAAAPLRAQGPSDASSQTVETSRPDSAVAAGPTLGSATVGVRHVDAASTKAAPAAARGGGRSHGEVLMIVGGAAILTGIVVGNNAGYAISIAGAVIGLYGLYEYLQ